MRFAPFKHPNRVYESKFGPRLGRILHALSALKNRSLRARDTSGLQRWNTMRKQIPLSPLRAVIASLDDPLSLLIAPEFRELIDEHRIS